jgi:MFS family permease
VTRPALLAAVGSGTLLNPLNSTMIAVALPALREGFGLSFSAAAWLISAYYLASAVGQPVMGRLSDLYGPRRVFLAGLVVVAAAGALGPLAPTLGWLLAVRVALALGTSTLFPSGMLIIDRVVGSRPARALGVVAMITAVSAAVGPTVGGGLVLLAGWPGIFLVNLPLAALAFVLALRFVPRDPVRAAAPAGLVSRLDLPGTAAFAAMVAMLFAFLVSLPTGPLWWALPCGLAAGAAFVAAELRARAPFIDVRTLRATPSLTMVYGHFVVVNVSFYAVLFGIPVYLQESRGMSAAEAGLALLPLEGLAVLTLPLTARLIDRVSPRAALVVGATCATAGSALLLTVGAGTGIAWVAVVLAVFGCSVGFNNLGLQAAMHEASPARMLGTAAGLFMTSRYFGTILSGSLLAIAFAERVGPGELHAVALVLAVLSAGTLALALLAPRSRTAADYV